AGNILPLSLVSAFSVALYGMFLAVIIPPARRDRVICLIVAVCFALSFAASKLPYISTVSEGTRTVILTVVISFAAALLFPRKDDKEEAASA
ncbi:MAG: branched-chain amino acid ABC transporter permease, partial [Clostridiales bacterium]|nr:branched-chain amino acid ABC transporter permease [Clostridiales bacterium]